MDALRAARLDLDCPSSHHIRLHSADMQREISSSTNFSSSNRFLLARDPVILRIPLSSNRHFLPARWSQRNSRVSRAVLKVVKDEEPTTSVTLEPMDLQIRSKGDESSPSPKLKDVVLLPNILKDMLGKVVGSARRHLLNAVLDLLYKPSDEENTYFTGNFAPVTEIGQKVPVQVIEGAVPNEFPPGTYIRTGPNPRFGGKFLISPFGKTKLHWFEGDGMLHATYFEKQGETFSVSYKNKYVETDDYLIEKARGKPTILPNMEGTPLTLGVNALLNQWRYAIPSKTTCNTSLWCHGGRVLVGAENGLPYQINVSDLSTVGAYDLRGEWNPTFTAHPKIDPETKEMIIQGCNANEPYYLLGVVSADGNRLVHKVDVGLKRAILSHDLAITPRFTLIFDFPLVIDIGRLMNGGNLIQFENDSYARIGVIPRYGDASSMRWYSVDVCFLFHVFNAFEEGNEIVLHGLRSRASFLHCDVNVDPKKWYARGITNSELRDGDDPWIDGALRTHIHEWRINIQTESIVERNLSEDHMPMLEMPKIHEAYTGKKYKYAYALGIDQEQSIAAGMPKYGKIVKVEVSGACNGKSSIKPQIHELGFNRYATEPFFVARPKGTEEDDGWILSYVHDENTGQSEVIIIDAQNIEDKPVARIALPQRVPYGFHGTFVPQVQ